MAAKFRMLRQKCRLCFRRSSSDDEEEIEEIVREPVRRATRPFPVQPVTIVLEPGIASPVQPVTTARAAGTDVFQIRRQKRVARLKFRWIREQLSGKNRGRRRTRTSSTSSTYSGDDARLRSDSVFDDDIAMTTVAMTTTSGTVVDPQPSTSHVITINGTAHPVRGESLTPGELARLRQRAAMTRSSAGRRRSIERPPTSMYDIQRRPLPNIAEERL